MNKSRTRQDSSSTALKSLEIKLEAMRTQPVISLNDCCIGDEGCQILAKFLNKYTSATDLELRGNTISGSGLTALAHVIKTNTTLRTISLEWNNLGASEAGLDAFFKALAENRSIIKVDLNNNEIGPEIGSTIASCLKSNDTLETLDLRWNRMGNAGAKAILKGLNMNKTMINLELAGNKVSDELLRSVSDILKSNKNGDRYFPTRDKFSSSGMKSSFNKGVHIHDEGSRLGHIYTSPSKRAQLEANLEDERMLVQEKRVDLVKELEHETKKRVEAEEAYEQLKEQFLKMELEDSRSKSEMQSRIDQLEQEKQNLQLKIIRISDQFDKGDLTFKEKQLTYEEILQESKRAYMQLDESYKTMIEKLSSEKQAMIKQQEKTYLAKIKNLEDNLKQFKELSEDQKRHIDLLEAQKIDQKLDFDTQLYNLEKTFQAEHTKQEDQRMKHLESVVDKMTKEREDLHIKMKQEAKMMQDKFKSVSDQIHKNEERTQLVNDKIQQLEKDNALLRGRVSTSQSELQQKEQLIDKLEGQKRDLERVIGQGKDFDKQQVEKLTNDIQRERKDYERTIGDLKVKINDLETQMSKVQSELHQQQQIKESLKESVRSALSAQVLGTFNDFRKKLQ